MLNTVKNAFKVKEIRVKLLFTLAMLLVIRLGSQLPVPGIDPEVIKRETGLSKNAFKRAVGRLYKERRVEITERAIRKI